MKKLITGFIAVLCTLGVFGGPGDWSLEGNVEYSDINATFIRIAVDSNETLYLSDLGNVASPRVVKWDNFTFCRENIGTPCTPSWSDFAVGTSGYGFQCISIDDSDNVFTLFDSGTEGTGWLKKFNSSGILQWEITTADRYSNGDIMSDGNLFTTHSDGSTRIYVSMDGAVSTSGYSFPSSSYPIGGAMDRVTDTYYYMGGGMLNKSGAGSSAPFGTATWNSTPTLIGPSCDFFAKDNTILAADEIGVHVIDAATGNELQTLVNDSGEFNCMGFLPRGVVAYSVGTTDYLVISGYNLNALMVYSKPNASPVDDWALLEK